MLVRVPESRMWVDDALHLVGIVLRRGRRLILVLLVIRVFRGGAKPDLERVGALVQVSYGFLLLLPTLGC